jgi:hypothetical protein
MNGKFTTSCLLFLLSAGAHAAESNLRGGGSRSLAPEPELFGFVGGEINPSTTFQPQMTPFQTNGKTTIPTLPFQFPTGGVVTTTFSSIPAVPTTLPFQFPTDLFTTTFPSIPVLPFQLDPTKLFQFGTPNIDYEPFYYGNIIGGLGLGGPLVGGGSCPKVPYGTPCTANYLPLSCGGCVYDNSCLAEAAGFSEGQCEPLP